MQIIEFYSHLNGLEFLNVNKPHLLEEIKKSLSFINIDDIQKKTSKEKTKLKKLLYSPTLIKKNFENYLFSNGWRSHKRDFLISSDIQFMKSAYKEHVKIQNEMAKKIKIITYKSSNKINLLKDRVSINLQLGKYSFVHFDIFNHISNYQDDIIDCGIIILPTKSMTNLMSTGVPIYERHVHEILRCRGAYPNVPLVLMGIDK